MTATAALTLESLSPRDAEADVPGHRPPALTAIRGGAVHRGCLAALTARDARRTEPGLEAPLRLTQGLVGSGDQLLQSSPSLRSATPTQAVSLPPGTSSELIAARTRSSTGAA